MRRLTGLSLAHPHVDAHRRGLFSLSSETAARTRRRIRAAGHDVFILSTCLRLELTWSGGPETATDLLLDLYGDAGILDLGVMRRDEDLFVHLSRVASGLASPIVGETEILTQFRQATEGYRNETAEMGDLLPVLEAAIGVGRSVRRVLGGATSGSLGSVAATTASGSTSVAILGAGAMARAAAQRLSGGQQLSVFARKSGLVAGHRTLPWARVPEALVTHAAVISTVPGGQPLVSNRSLSAALEARRQPLLLIDLGMPPGFDISALPFRGQYLGVDDMATAATTAPPAAGEQVLAEEALRGWRRVSSPPRVGSVISALVEKSDRAVDEEVERFVGRLRSSEDPEAVLRQLAHTVARRILHSPIAYVRSQAGEGTSTSTDVIAAAFGIDDE